MQRNSAGDVIEFNRLLLIGVCIQNFQFSDSLPTQGMEYQQ